MALAPNVMSSGTGFWTLASDGTVVPTINTHEAEGLTFVQQPAGTTIDPANMNALTTVKLLVELGSTGPVHIAFIGDASTKTPTPPDSIGFSAKTEIDIVNNTGQTLHNLTLNLTNADPDSPLSLVPGVIQFGHTINANYAYFTDIQPVAGLMMGLLSPDNKPTTPTGAAASTIGLAGDIAPGSTTTLLSTIHNTELAINNNDFTLTITPS